MKKALSIKNPWSVLLAMGIKDVENRTWKTPYRGKILIHCSSTFDPRFKNGAHCFTKEQVEAIAKFQLESNNPTLRNLEPEEFLNKYKGCIIGEMTLVDCEVNYNSIWVEQTPEEYMDKPIYNWVVKDAVFYDEPIPNVMGRLNLWNYEG